MSNHRDWLYSNGVQSLTPEQEVMLDYHIKAGNFIGCGRGIGINGLFPVVRRGKGPMVIIDKTGNEQFAAKFPLMFDEV